MPQYAYGPATGELIRTDTPSDWMGATDVAPPEFDPATAGCFWRGAGWEIVPGEVPAPLPNPRIAVIKARLDQIDIESIRALRTKAVGKSKPADDTKLNALDAEADNLRAELAVTTEFI